MNQLFFALTQNAALLVALSVLYGLLSRFRAGQAIRFKILAGLLFGVIAVAGMSIPVHYQSGIFYDGRSIVLVLSGLFGGGLTAAITVLLTGAYRIYVGGIGVFAGILTIVLCAAVGLTARKLFKDKPGEISILHLLIISLAAHVLMLLSQLAIAWDTGLVIISEIWLPVLTIFPLATLIIAILLQTEEKRLQSLASIMESEKRYQTLSEKSPIGIFRTRPDGYTTYVNPRWCQITGLSLNDAMGNGWLDAVHPDDKIKILDGWNKATNQQTKSIAEYRYIKPNQEVVWIFGEAVAELSETGEVVGYIGSITDVTAKKKAEEELRLLGKALEQSPVSITISDRKGVIEYVNPKFSEITGFSYDEVIGTNSDILNSKEYSNAFSKSIWDTIASGKDWIGEVENQRKNGDYYWESLIISPIFDSTGQITNFISIKEDITERKQMIREVIVAKEKAEEAEHLKSAFLANMSHEIRTPLNAILGFTTLLTTNSITEKTREDYITIINKNADGLLHIINDILDISKLETGQVTIRKQAFLIEPMLESLQIQYENKLVESGKSGIRLERFPTPPDLEIVSDKNRLTQILSNLLDNAGKFTDSGIITFGVSRVFNGHLELTVVDTGIGISKKDQASIFERFRQVGESNVRINSGNGLGLAIVKSLVELMGGQIEFESVLGEGTSFRIRLPLQ